MADSISQIPVTTTNGVDEFKARWGVSVYDYELNGVAVDFQDLMVAISEHRATAVEGEVGPLSTRMRKRNKDLEILGSLLAIFSEAQSRFKSEDSGSATTVISGITQEMYELGGEAYRRKGGTPEATSRWWNSSWSKSSIEGMVSVLKSMIDERNNAAQNDMTRLQSLVDRRDESFTTATTLMTNVSDTRDNAIRNL